MECGPLRTLNIGHDPVRYWNMDVAESIQRINLPFLGMLKEFAFETPSFADSDIARLWKFPTRVSTPAVEAELQGGNGALPSLAGGHVVATCRNPEKAEALQELATSHPGRLTILPLDVTDEATIKAAATAVKTKLGRLDLLLNVTGVLHIPDVLTPGAALIPRRIYTVAQL
eukprot:gene2501-3245_t